MFSSKMLSYMVWKWLLLEQTAFMKADSRLTAQRRDKTSLPIHLLQSRHATFKPCLIVAPTGLILQIPSRDCLCKLLCLIICHVFFFLFLLVHSRSFEVFFHLFLQGAFLLRPRSGLENSPVTLDCVVCMQWWKLLDWCTPSNAAMRVYVGRL